MALNLPLDTKFADKINRRRIAEDQRKQRIFNAKERQMGVDVEALNHQMHENILSRNKEIEIENHFANETRKQDNLAVLFDQRQEEEIRELNKKIDEFRFSQQRPEYRRDYDLYDPDQLKKERPPRISDQEKCPVSGLQKFEGEDLNYKGRSAKQKEQVKDILLQQMQEKRMKNYMEDKEASDWEALLLSQDYNALQIGREELDNSKKASKNLSHSNKYLATETTEKKMQEKINEDYEKRKDIENCFYSDLLSENPLVARSAFGSHRVVPDRWKGMNKQQLEEYYEGQIQQIIDKKRNKDLENYETAKWDEQILRQETNAQLQMEEEQVKKAEINKKMAMENLQLSQQQRMQQDYINKVVYSNIPSDGYFAQFNTSSR